MGPELQKLLRQESWGREYYTREHLARLYGSTVPWGRENRGSKTWCKDVHPPGCQECTSCHFCRQKTTDVKTFCKCAHARGRIVAGKARGQWCGWCLEMRIGENIDEALQDPEWMCPICRDICNCSGANCLRSRRGLPPTNQLVHEASNLHYDSVAHYVILALLTEGGARPLPDLSDLPGSRRRVAGKAQGSRQNRGRNMGKQEATNTEEGLGELSQRGARAEQPDVHAEQARRRVQDQVSRLQVLFPMPASWSAPDREARRSGVGGDSNDECTDSESDDRPSDDGSDVEQDEAEVPISRLGADPRFRRRSAADGSPIGSAPARKRTRVHAADGRSAAGIHVEVAGDYGADHEVLGGGQHPSSEMAEQDLPDGFVVSDQEEEEVSVHSDSSQDRTRAQKDPLFTSRYPRSGMKADPLKLGGGRRLGTHGTPAAAPELSGSDGGEGAEAGEEDGFVISDQSESEVSLHSDGSQDRTRGGKDPLFGAGRTRAAAAEGRARGPGTVADDAYHAALAAVAAAKRPSLPTFDSDDEEDARRAAGRARHRLQKRQRPPDPARPGKARRQKASGAVAASSQQRPRTRPKPSRTSEGAGRARGRPQRSAQLWEFSDEESGAAWTAAREAQPGGAPPGSASAEHGAAEGDAPEGKASRGEEGAGVLQPQRPEGPRSPGGFRALVCDIEAAPWPRGDGPAAALLQCARPFLQRLPNRNAVITEAPELAGAGGDGAGCIADLQDLMAASDALVLLAERLPASQLPSLCRRLPRPRHDDPLSVTIDTSQPLAPPATRLAPGLPLCDFSRSGAPARMVLLRLGFRLMEAAAGKGAAAPLSTAIASVLAMLGEMAAELVYLRTLKDAIAARSPGAASGPPVAAAGGEIPAGDGSELGARRRGAAAEELLKVAHFLVETTVAHMHAALHRRDMRNPRNHAYLELIGPSLGAFLDPSLPLQPALRTAVFRVVAAATATCAEPPASSGDRGGGEAGGVDDAAMLEAEDEEEFERQVMEAQARKAQRVAARTLAQRVQQHIWPWVRALLEADFPNRCPAVAGVAPGNSGRAGRRGWGDALGGASPEGTGLTVGALVRMFGVSCGALVCAGELRWEDVEAEAQQPQGRGDAFWLESNRLYRQLAVRLVAAALRNIRAFPPEHGADPHVLMRLWLLAAADPAAAASSRGRRLHAQLTRALTCVPACVSYLSGACTRGAGVDAVAQLEAAGRQIAGAPGQAAAWSAAFLRALACREDELAADAELGLVGGRRAHRAAATWRRSAAGLLGAVVRGLGPSLAGGGGKDMGELRELLGRLADLLLAVVGSGGQPPVAAMHTWLPTLVAGAAASMLWKPAEGGASVGRGGGPLALDPGILGKAVLPFVRLCLEPMPACACALICAGAPPGQGRLTPAADPTWGLRHLVLATFVPRYWRLAGAAPGMASSAARHQGLEAVLFVRSMLLRLNSYRELAADGGEAATGGSDEAQAAAAIRAHLPLLLGPLLDAATGVQPSSPALRRAGELCGRVYALVDELLGKVNCVRQSAVQGARLAANQVLFLPAPPASKRMPPLSIQRVRGLQVLGASRRRFAAACSQLYRHQLYA
ncbi:hypothetical protein CYMTET_47841 [Cymbomonas tetramitiformis]|uniref:Zinc-finger domain-containing protein n=1 Tax=Cymbomonas tetramitiformis TaxID=36881 RepID=A0AAE0BTF7_9CHLO|nr:hypothetical protein CYMTET_47841 [Cymbomonas tetramitiformis]